MLEDRLDIAKGRQLNLETVKRLDEVGFDFVCLTGNPGTGVTNEQIEKAISFTKRKFLRIDHCRKNAWCWIG